MMSGKCLARFPGRFFVAGQLRSSSSFGSLPGGCGGGGKAKKEHFFFRERVQETLVRLTGMDYSKIFRVAKRGQEIHVPSYAFLTDEELSIAMKDAEDRALKMLQMPPVMDERSEEVRVIDEDPGIVGYDSAKLVFTDITYGIHDRERLIVVREPDGKLRHASGYERDRLNQIYFQKEGRKVYLPPMFEPQNLEDILRPDRYLYILDRNCVQFEPDHPMYIRTASRVYEHINENGHYDVLKSTRHYGPMVFHLVWNKACDDLLSHYLMEGDLESAADVVTLFFHIHGMEENASVDSDEAKLEHVRPYAQKAASKPVKVQSALDTMLEIRRRNLQATMGIEGQSQS